MFALLRQRNFSLLWFGGLISFIGDWVLFVALPVYIFQLTGSVLATGTMFVVSILPNILLGSVAGVFVDRWDRRKTLIITNVLEGALLLPLLLVHSADQVWITYVVALLARLAGQFSYPAEHALLPRLVPKDDLMQANALNSMNDNISRLVGPALGGMALATLGFGSAVLIDATSFLAAGTLIALIAAPASVTRGGHSDGAEVEAAAEPKKSVWREWLGGLRVVRHNHAVASVFAVVGILMLAEGLLSVLIVPYVQEVLGGGALEFGWLMTAQAVGGLLGSLLIGRISKLIQPRLLIGPSLIIDGVLLVAIFNTPYLPVMMVLIALAGLPIVAALTGIQTIFQTDVDDQFRGRVFGAYMTTISLVLLLGRLFASFFGTAFGVTLLLSAAGVFDICAGIAGVWLLRGRPSTPAPASEAQGERPVLSVG